MVTRSVRLARTDVLWLLVLASLVALGLTLDVLLLYGVVVAVQAVLTWPIVRLAGIVFLIGGALFLLSEQCAEIYAIAQEREAARR